MPRPKRTKSPPPNMARAKRTKRLVKGGKKPKPVVMLERPHLIQIDPLFRHPFLDFGRKPSVFPESESRFWLALGAVTANNDLGRKETVEKSMTHIFNVANKLNQLFPTFYNRGDRFWKAVHVEVARIAPVITTNLDFEDLRKVVDVYATAYNEQHGFPEILATVHRRAVASQHKWRMGGRKPSRFMSFNEFVNQRVALLTAIYTWVNAEYIRLGVISPAPMPPVQDLSVRLPDERVDAHFERIFRHIDALQRSNKELFEKISELNTAQRQTEDMSWDEMERVRNSNKDLQQRLDISTQELQVTRKQLEDANKKSEATEKSYVELMQRVVAYRQMVEDKKGKLEHAAGSSEDGEDQWKGAETMIDVAIWQHDVEEPDEEDEDEEESDDYEETDDGSRSTMQSDDD